MNVREEPSPPVQRAAGVILYRLDGEEPYFLLLRNRLHGTWGFPKGRAERGETEAETARRETIEETGITAWRQHPDFRTAISYPVRAQDGRLKKTVTFFLGRVGNVEVKRSEEHDDVCWALPEDAWERLFHRDLRNVLDDAVAAIRASLS